MELDEHTGYTKGITVWAENPYSKISLVIRKELRDGGYWESYTFTNDKEVELFVNKDTLSAGCIAPR